VPERPATAEPGYPEPWVEAKWKKKQLEIKQKALEEETKGNMARPVQVDVFGGMTFPVKPIDPERHSRVYKHLRETLQKTKALEDAAHSAERAASTPPGWSDSWVKDKWKREREKVACERGSDDLPPKVKDLLGDRYDHPPWIRLLQQPQWKVKLEQKEALAARATKDKPMTARFAKKCPPAPVSMEERPPGPVMKRLERNDASEEKYLATVIGRTAAKEVMLARRQRSARG